MATHDYVLDNATGANFRADLNLVLAAIVSNNSSSSEPSTKYAYQWWADTNEGVLKIRNSSNDGWVTLLQLDGTLTLEDGSASAPALGFRDDLNTGIFSSAADTLDVSCGGTTRGSFSSSGLAVTGNVTATTFVGNVDAVDGDFDGTLEADAITVAGTALSTVIAGTTVTTATNANHVSVADNESTNENNLIPFIEDASATGNVGLESDGDFTYNPSTGTVTATAFSGSGASLTALNIVTDTSPQLGGQLDTNGNIIKFPDSSGASNNRLAFGNASDLTIFHDGSTGSFVNNANHDLYLQNSSVNTANQVFIRGKEGENSITCHGNGGVELYYDNTKRFETETGGARVTGGLNVSGNIALPDSSIFIAGTGDDLQIYHDGTNSYVKNNTGVLYLQGDNIRFLNDAGNENIIKAFGNGAVELSFDSSKKFETTSTGIDVTGAITVNGSALDTGGGITMAQQWRQHTNTSNPSSITQNWEVNDNTIYGGIGSSMSEAAGVFTFPSTGIYYIAVDQTFHVTSNGEDRRCEIHIQSCTSSPSSNSSYSDLAIGYANLGVGSSTTFGTASCSAFVDITDVSNRKVRFTASVNNSNTQLTGNSGYNENSYVFIRLGDT